MAKENKKPGLLVHLTFDKEARSDGHVSPPVESGRIKFFFAMLTKHNSDLILPGLLFLVTALPLFGVYIFLRVYGAEKLLYDLLKITELPYLMTNIGIGISSGADVFSLKTDMLKVYQLFFVAVGFAMFIMSIGLSGLLRLAAKFIWSDSFITKKDNYGNNVPRTIIEFFEGVKKYCPQMLVWGAIAFILVAGVGNSVIFFISGLWSGTAGAGHYIILILACIIGLLGAMFLMYFAPFIVMYDIPMAAKIKNSAIFTIQMFVPNLFILAVIAAPVIAAALTNGFINVIFVALLVVFGGTFYTLLTGNYVQYYAEKIMTPVYTAQVSKQSKNKKKKK
ncbi:MAG TPA: hypothetical protein PKY53_03860 [Clostridia bacterium]|jgi:hypothetical protein|nr:hypothetical protein [Clostridia bacterium]